MNDSMGPAEIRTKKTAGRLPGRGIRIIPR